MNDNTRKVPPGYMLAKAIKIAVDKFDGHFDKGGMPYILHCLKVLHYLNSEDEDEQCAAVLHDLVEDVFAHDHQAGYLYLRREGFSERVILYVAALTKAPDETEEQTVSKVCQYRATMKIKLSDLRHNSDIRRLKGLREKDFTRLQKYCRMHVAITERLGS